MNKMKCMLYKRGGWLGRSDGEPIGHTNERMF